jgi:hypothetical protein
MPPPRRIKSSLLMIMYGTPTVKAMLGYVLLVTGTLPGISETFI